MQGHGFVAAVFDTVLHRVSSGQRAEKLRVQAREVDEFQIYGRKPAAGQITIYVPMYDAAAVKPQVTQHELLHFPHFHLPRPAGPQGFNAGARVTVPTSVRMRDIHLRADARVHDVGHDPVQRPGDRRVHADVPRTGLHQLPVLAVHAVDVEITRQPVLVRAVAPGRCIGKQSGPALEVGECGTGGKDAHEGSNGAPERIIHQKITCWQENPLPLSARCTALSSSLMTC